MHLLRLATWNLERPARPSRRKQEALRYWMSLVKADVWVLTETHDGVSPGEGFASASSSGSEWEGDPGERWVTIWSRFPLEPLTTSDPVRTAAARIQHPVHPFIVYGTVLPWLGSTWRGYKSAGGEAFRQALQVQCEDWLRLSETYGNSIFLAGDFNQDLSHTHYYGSKVNRAELEGALESANLQPLTAGRHDPIRRDSPSRACIDHICLSKNSIWHPVNTLRWPNEAEPVRWLSDHFGVAVGLEERLG